MKASVLAFILLSMTQNLFSQTEAPSLTAAPADDAELKKLEWNRYVTKNFTILSIDNEKGKLLSENLDSLKAFAMKRWGFPDVPFSKECRVFVVPDYILLKKLFNLNVGKVQLRKELNVIWTVGDDKPNKSMLPYVTTVCLSEYEVSQATVLPTWFKKGCVVLNNAVPEIKEFLKSYNDVARKEQFTHTAEQMLNATEEDYNKQTNENRIMFDQQAALLCLMLRKEFGEAKLQGFLRLQPKNKPEVLLDTLYGFKSYTQFDRQYVRYMKDLCADLVENHTPDSYLEIKPAR